MTVQSSTHVEYKRILVDGVHYYGKHLVLTATGCNDSLLDIPSINTFLTTLVTRIDIVARFGEGIEEGISAVQLIETSAITIHTNDMARDLYLDVFSCKGYNELAVIAYLEEVFNPSAINWQVLLRK